MPHIPNALFLVVFGASAVYGFILVMKRTRQIRARGDYKDVLYEWAERPGSGFHDDLPTWVAINVHRGTAILLGLVALFLLLVRPVESLSPPDWPLILRFVLDPLVVGLVSVIGFLWGFLTGGPIAERLGGDRHYAVSEAGVVGSGQVVPWEALSHVSVDRERGSVRIWSKSLPGTIAFSFHPPAEGRAALLRVLQGRLRTGGEPEEWGQRYGFALRMVLLCAPFAAAGLVLAWLPTGPALLALCVLMWALLAVGSAFIMRTVYGRKGKNVNSES